MSTIHRRAQENLDEKGINTLFAAVGLATWEVESGVSPNAPVILISITVSPSDAARRNFKLEMSGDPHLNPVLVHVLREEHGLEPFSKNGDPAEGLSGSLSGIASLLGELESQWSKVRGLAINHRIVMGNFSYTNMPMVADLEDNLSSFGKSDLVAAIAGVDQARRTLADRIRDPSLNRPDVDPPQSEFLVLDADASQHRAINRAIGGESVVIWGPPGTGKSQTIANLIVSLNAVGKRVLFVAEKRAAIEVVVARLQRAGLGELVMDAHGGIKSKREFARSMAESMRAVRTVPLQDYSDLHGRLRDTRAQLINHVEAMHEIREPWNVSLYDVQEKLLAAPWQIAASTGMTSAKARELDRAKVDQLMREVQEWTDLRGQELDSLYPEWSHCNVNTPEEAREALSLVRKLSTLALPDTRASVLALLDEAGMTRAETVGAWHDLLLWLKGLGGFLSEFDDEILTLDHRTLIAALVPARQWWKPWVVLTSGKYRAARNAVRKIYLTGAKLRGEEALLALERASEFMERWSSTQSTVKSEG